MGVKFVGGVSTAPEVALHTQDLHAWEGAVLHQGAEQHGAGATNGLVIFEGDQLAIGLGQGGFMTGKVWLVGKAIGKHNAADALLGQGLAGGDALGNQGTDGGNGDALGEVSTGVGNGDRLAPCVINAFWLEADGETFATAEEEDAVRVLPASRSAANCGWLVPWPTRPLRRWLGSRFAPAGWHRTWPDTSALGG